MIFPKFAKCFPNFVIKRKLGPTKEIWDTVPSIRIRKIYKQNLNHVYGMIIEKITFKK